MPGDFCVSNSFPFGENMAVLAVILGANLADVNGTLSQWPTLSPISRSTSPR